MKPAKALISGFTVTLRSWRAVIVMWLVSLVLTSLVAIPVKSSFKAALGKSMITEKFTGGIIAEVIPDLGTSWSSMLSSISAGLFFLVFVWLLINIFFAGGIFGLLRKDNADFSLASFYRKASGNFSSFLVIMLVMNLLVLLTFLVSFVVPLILAGVSESVSEAGVFRTFLVSGSVTFVFLLFLLGVTDYARAWKAADTGSGSFRAIGFGFRHTFRTFPSSFLFMLMIVLIQMIPAFAAYRLISVQNPTNGEGIFLFVLLSQLLFFVKIVLRILRYAGMTEMFVQYQTGKIIAVNKGTVLIDVKPETDYII